MGTTRKLEGTSRDLRLMAEQGKVKSFLNNTRNADKLRDLLEDIRAAMMEYQVRVNELAGSPQNLILEPDFVATRCLRQKLSTHCESFSSILRSCGVLNGG